jgi:hypothetical protein
LYEVTPYLVPFLARSAAARIASVDTMYSLGAIAECDDARQEPGIRGKSKAAFAQHIALLLPLLSLMDSWRGSVHALDGPLASFISDDDPDIGVTAIETLGRNGVTSPVSDELAALADAGEPDARAVAALKCLAEIRDPRFPILLARDFPRRAAALDKPHRASALDALVDTGKVPFDPALLEAVRENLRLTRQEARWQLLLLKLLGRWGSTARSAIPDVLAVLPNHEYQVGCTLADLGAAREAVPLLSTVASTDSTGSRIGAAKNCAHSPATKNL